MAIGRQTSIIASSTTHVRTLAKVYMVWKALLLLIACVSPGFGYDTSTQLLLPQSFDDDPVLVKAIAHAGSKLVRWDALYFIRTAQRGYVFEQEWAFGWGFTRLISTVARALALTNAEHFRPLLREAVAGIMVAHTFHLLSVFILFTLTLKVLPVQYPEREKTAVLAAVLHIVSPAGVFLSAPYSESVFACLNFLGMLLYSRTYTDESRKTSSMVDTAAILGAGLCWGVATSVRGNGILSGIMLLYRCVSLLESLPSRAAFKSLAATIVAGLLVAVGSIVPQGIAYSEYCLQAAAGRKATWCSEMPPSIFAWVQAHYWNVGFLRYWTLSNAPLFALALPMLCLTLATAYIGIVQPGLLLEGRSTHTGVEHKNSKSLNTYHDEQRFISCIRCFALPQAVLALLTLTNFHVQIINRLSSGYPVWYIVLAMAITSTKASTAACNAIVTGELKSKLRVDSLTAQLRRRGVQKSIFCGMITYALVQCGLYASFMPPA